jgi:hypothetical protein
VALELASCEGVGMDLIWWFGRRGCDALVSVGFDRIAREFKCFSELGDGVYYFGIGIIIVLFIGLLILAQSLRSPKDTNNTDSI